METHQLSDPKFREVPTLLPGSNKAIKEEYQKTNETNKILPQRIVISSSQFPHNRAHCASKRFQ